MPGVRWAAIGAAAIVACTSSSPDCTEIGCFWGANSSVLVVAPPLTDLEGVEITVCIDGDCEVAVPLDEKRVESEGVPEGAFVFVVPGADDGDEVTAILTAAGGQLTGSATMASSRPNGPDCEPTCVYAEVMLVAG